LPKGAKVEPKPARETKTETKPEAKDEVKKRVAHV